VRPYTVRLHFNEFFWSQSGQRIFDMAINATTVLSRQGERHRDHVVRY
jgi:hypothetical protein